MKVIIFGATGMVGQGVLRECLIDDEITSVLTVGRTMTGIANPKLHEIKHADLRNYGLIADRLAGFDACFFCLGISSTGMKEADYDRMTYGITLAAAEALSRLSPGMVFTYVSGAGTDSSEQGRVMWARVKGRTENALLKLPFKAAYMFRPGAIRPMHKEVSKTISYRLMYALASPVLPVLQRAFPNAILTTEIIGRAMINVVRQGFPKAILDPPDIYAIALRSRLSSP
jgi:uncharacterized protein YbjT (DUF2867 family)